jgi:hypothetical protein
MKVLAGLRLDAAGDPGAADMCRRLAGSEGSVVSLRDLGVRNAYRPWSAAEIEALRGVLRTERVREDGPPGSRGVIGYVCGGVAAPGREPGWVAVTDHANLTWCSPLAGRNDEADGPRFPGMMGVYDPDPVMSLEAGSDGMIVIPGVVAGVQRDLAMSTYETEMVERLGWAAASSELVAPVIIAAHLGLRVAAVVMAVRPKAGMTEGKGDEWWSHMM